MSKHTPGPWKLRRVTRYDIRIAPESEPEHVSIAGMAIWGEEDREELEANARLIAAAPELLEALKELREALSDSGITTPYGSRLMRSFLKANAAIARVEGGQS